MIKVSDIKNNISIDYIVERYVDLEPAQNGEKMGVCPFHDDNDPSMFVNIDKGVYNCFGCGSTGDVIDFVMKIEDASFKEAVEIITGDDFSNQNIIFDSKTKKQEDLLSLVNKESSHKINESLVEEYKQYTHQYLLDRGYTEEILNEYDVGYCPNPNDDLYNRVTFAWRDLDGNLVAIAGRDVTEKSSAKYKTKKNGSKAYTFFNAYRVSQLDTKSVIVVEDEKSVIRLGQFGYPNAVALGNNDLGERKWQLRQLAETAILAFDNDEEGVSGRNKAIKKLLPLMNIEVIKLDGYKDIADIEDKEVFDSFYKNKDRL